MTCPECGNVVRCIRCDGVCPVCGAELEEDDANEDSDSGCDGRGELADLCAV